MALFKPFRGNRASLDAQPLHDGYAYFCTDDGTFHIDHTDADGNLQRTQLNSKDAETLSGMSLDELKTSLATQTDYNQQDPTAADYIKNKPFYTDIVKTEIVNGTYTSELDTDLGIFTTNIVYSGDGSNDLKADVILDGEEYSNLIIADLMEILGCYAIGNLSFLNPLLEALVGTNPNFEDTGEPFIGLLYDNLFRLGTDFTQSTTHNLSLDVYETQVIKIDEKYLPNEWSTLQEQSKGGVTVAYFYIKNENQTITINCNTEHMHFIDWGDGIVDKKIKEKMAHTYALPGQYVCKIGTMSGLNVENMFAIEEGQTPYLSSIVIDAFNNSSIYLEDGVFDGQSALQRVVFSNRNTDITSGVIGEFAFRNSSLNKIILPKTINQIQREAFYECKRLTTIELPEKLLFIGNRAFGNCINLTKIVIPNSIEVIAEDAFEGCSLIDVTCDYTALPAIPKEALRTITITEGAIGEKAFSASFKLETVFLKNGVTYIGRQAFFNKNITEIVIPDSVTTISTEAFDSCSLLKEVIIGSGVDALEDSAFASCTQLQTVTFRGSVPTALGDGIFLGCTNLSKILVPAGSVDAYKAALPDYADIIDGYAMASDLEGVATETYVQDYVAQNAAAAIQPATSEEIYNIFNEEA